MWKIVISFKCVEGGNTFKLNFPYNKDDYMFNIILFKNKYDKYKKNKIKKNILKTRKIH